MVVVGIVVVEEGEVWKNDGREFGEGVEVIEFVVFEVSVVVG